MGEKHAETASCPNCNGTGILIGPLDERTHEPEVAQCARCNGYGCRVRDFPHRPWRMLFTRTPRWGKRRRTA